MFHSFHGLMNSINWPASSVWVFIAQLGEHCSANAEATGSNPVEAPKSFFWGYFRNCLNCDSLRWSHTHFICIPAVHIISFSVSYIIVDVVVMCGYTSCVTLIDLIALFVEFTVIFCLAHISFVFRLLVMVIMIRK